MKKISMLVLAASVFGVSALAGAQSVGNGAMANLYFNDTADSGALAVWVDGQKIISGNFAGTPTVNARQLTAGQHLIVVTPFYATPGVKDFARGTVNVPAGTSTLHVTKYPSNKSLSSGFLVDTLYFTSGAPN